MSFSHDVIYDVVRRIPGGRVATYGQIAYLAGFPRHARQAGYALAALKGRDAAVPWHRVVNAKGGISPRSDGQEDFQRILLEEEGIVFDEKGRISLARFQWQPHTEQTVHGQVTGVV